MIHAVEVIAAWKKSGIPTSALELNGSQFLPVDIDYIRGPFSRYFAEKALSYQDPEWVCLEFADDATARIRRKHAKQSSNARVLFSPFHYHPVKPTGGIQTPSLNKHAICAFIYGTAGDWRVGFWEPQNQKIVTLDEDEKGAHLFSRF